MPYIVKSFEADGITDPYGHRSEHNTLEEARAEVRRLLGVARLHKGRRFTSDTIVEGWNAVPASHPRAYGCGGYVIVAAE